MARIAFFGTPDFALPSLRALWNYCEKSGHNLAVIVTQPDKKQGRGQRLLAGPVKSFALEHNIPTLQPESLRKNTPSGDEFFQQFKELSIDLAVVVAYGKIITQRILNLPRLHFVNIHASILP